MLPRRFQTSNGMGIVVRQSIKGTVATYIGVAVGIVTTFFVQTKALQPEQIGLIDVLLQCSLLFGGFHVDGDVRGNAEAFSQSLFDDRGLMMCVG